MIKRVVFLLCFVFSIISGVFSLFMGDKFWRLIGFVDVSVGLFWCWAVLLVLSVGLSMWAFVLFVLDLRHEHNRIIAKAVIDDVVREDVSRRFKDLEMPIPPKPVDEFFSVWDESLGRQVTCVRKGVLLVAPDGKCFSLDGELIGRSGLHG